MYYGLMTVAFAITAFRLVQAKVDSETQESDFAKGSSDWQQGGDTSDEQILQMLLDNIWRSQLGGKRADAVRGYPAPGFLGARGRRSDPDVVPPGFMGARGKRWPAEPPQWWWNDKKKTRSDKKSNSDIYADGFLGVRG